MTTFYRDASVHVNSSVINVDGRGYQLSRLGEVWLVKGPWQVGRAVAVLALRALVGAAAVGLVGCVAAVVTDPHRPLAVWAYLFASPVVLGALVVAAERTRERGLRHLLLCAEYGGPDPVVVYTTTDARRFGQVHRAVVRALEHRELD